MFLAAERTFKLGGFPCASTNGVPVFEAAKTNFGLETSVTSSLLFCLKVSVVKRRNSGTKRPAVVGGILTFISSPLVAFRLSSPVRRSI